MQGAAVCRRDALDALKFGRNGSEAQRGYAREYQPRTVVQFVQNATDLTRGRLMLKGIDEDEVRAKEAHRSLTVLLRLACEGTDSEE